MRAMIAATIFVGVFLVAPSAIAGGPQFAQQPAPPRVPAPLFPTLPPAAPVAPLPALTPQFALPSPPMAPTRVVCGMTVIEGNAKIDQQMVIHNGSAGTSNPKPVITVVQPS